MPHADNIVVLKTKMLSGVDIIAAFIHIDHGILIP